MSSFLNDVLLFLLGNLLRSFSDVWLKMDRLSTPLRNEKKICNDVC